MWAQCSLQPPAFLEAPWLPAWLYEAPGASGPGFGFSLGNGAKCVSLPPCSLTDAPLLPSSSQPAPHTAHMAGPRDPQLSLAPTAVQSLEQHLLAAQGGLELGLQRGRGLSPKGPESRSPSRWNPRLLGQDPAPVHPLFQPLWSACCMPGPGRGAEEDARGFCPTRDPCLWGWVVPSFPYGVGLAEQDQREEVFVPSQSGHFLLRKPERVRGLQSCMRKNLHLP